MKKNEKINANIYIFDTAYYLEWCKINDLNKNNQRTLQLFKARCDFEKVYKAIKENEKKSGA